MADAAVPPERRLDASLRQLADRVLRLEHLRDEVGGGAVVNNLEPYKCEAAISVLQLWSGTTDDGIITVDGAFVLYDCGISLVELDPGLSPPYLAAFQVEREGVYHVTFTGIISANTATVGWAGEYGAMTMLSGFPDLPYLQSHVVPAFGLGAGLGASTQKQCSLNFSTDLHMLEGGMVAALVGPGGPWTGTQNIQVTMDMHLVHCDCPRNPPPANPPA